MVSFFSEVSQRYTERPCTKGEHTYNVRGENYLVTTFRTCGALCFFFFFWGGGIRRSASCLSWRVAWKTVQVQILQVIEVVVEPDVSLRIFCIHPSITYGFCFLLLTHIQRKTHGGLYQQKTEYCYTNKEKKAFPC